MLTSQQIKKAKLTKLSKNFTLWECIKSNRVRLISWPTNEIIDRLRLGCQMLLQPLRNKVGPVKINSGYRNPAINRAVKGSKNSDHMAGIAFDIHCPTYSYRRKVYYHLHNRGLYRQLIWYDTFIHVSYNLPGKPFKQQILDKRK